MCPPVSFPGTMRFSSCFLRRILARSVFVMAALCLHYAIRPSFTHPSSLFPSSQLACFAPGGMLLRENFALHGFGRSEFSWDVQSLQVLCECFPRGSIGTDWTARPLTRTHDLLQGRSWDWTLVHTVILAGFLLVLVDFSLGWLVPQS